MRKLKIKKKARHKLRTISDLARHLEVSCGYVQEMVAMLETDASRLYRSWDQTKSSGGTRPIDGPKDKLKYLQKRVNEKILQRTRVSRIAKGGVRGSRLKDNLLPHLGQPMVANFDLKNFFSNITHRQVYRTFVSMGASPDVARVLTRLTTFKGRIPQGAPTSPMLANLVAGYGGMLSLDERIIGLCKKYRFHPTRWIDDISLSGSSFLEKFESTLERIMEQSGFTPNKKKTNFASKNTSQIVTGHLVNIKPNTRKQPGREIRAMLHKCRTLGPERCAEGSVDHLKSSLRGRIAHIASINPDTGTKLLFEFNSIQWPSDTSKA